MKNELWAIIVITMGFLGFMMGYSVPPFLEVGFGTGEVQTGSGSGPSEQELMDQYLKMLEENSSSE